MHNNDFSFNLSITSYLQNAYENLLATPLGNEICGSRLEPSI